MKETRSIFVTFSDDELAERKGEHYAVLREIDEVKLKHKGELAPFKRRVKSLVECIEEGGEKRSIECEWRDSNVNGVRECVRLDTNEVVDTLTEGDDEPEEERAQPGLPFARPDAPELRCTAIDEDGVAHPITAEQADAAERVLSSLGGPFTIVTGDGITEPASRIDRVVKILRARACEFCGAADGNHRQPECDQAKNDAAAMSEIALCESCNKAIHEGDAHTYDADEAVYFCAGCTKTLGASGALDAPSWKVGDEVRLKSGGPVMKVIGLSQGVDTGEPSVVCEWSDDAGGLLSGDFHPATLEDSYDRNSTEAVAAKIAEVAPPDDRPLTARGIESATAKPKRTKSKARSAGSEAE